MASRSGEKYYFGEFQLDSSELSLSLKGQAVHLTPKAIQTLLLLVRNARQVLPRTEMIKALWPESYVEDSNLTVTIAMLRRALGDHEDGNQFIVTIPKIGYRFDREVRVSFPERSNTGIARDPYRRNGSLVASRYELVEYAGAGGMGAVYRAFDQVEQTIVAVKFLKPDIAARSPEYVELFEKEARIAQGLRHPHIVTILDSGTDEDLPFMVMEWIDGKSLEDVVSAGVLPMSRIVHLLAQICDAVSFAHDNNVIHLDIKPANILLPENAQSQDFVKVIDFGLSRIISKESGTTVTMFRGTHQFCAPEQFGGRVTHRSDIYSLAATLYNLISGVVPFGTSYVHAKMHANLELPQISSLTNYRNIPVMVDQVIGKALNKDPKKRQESARQLFDEFATAIGTPGCDSDSGVTAPAQPPVREEAHLPLTFDGDHLKRLYDDLAECTFDEYGNCTNQMHWGANE